MILKAKGFWGSLSGMFLGVFGIGCVACSGLILAPLISFLGLSSIFNLLPMKGMELGYLGTLVILISDFYILKKITDPNICKK